MTRFFADGKVMMVPFAPDQAFMILRSPLDRWMSALNMYLDGGMGYRKTMKDDPHFKPQTNFLSGYDVDKIRYYDLNKSIFMDVIKGEKLLRYKNNKKPTINMRKIKMFRFDVEHNKKAYALLPKRLKGCKPEDYGLYPTLKETLEYLNEEYKEDILFYNNRKFVNR